MGVCTFLVSEEQQDYFDFGKVFLNEEVLDQLDDEGLPHDADERASARAALLINWFADTDGQFNSLEEDTASEIAAKAAEWMSLHEDWRFVTDADEDYEDHFYLAVDDDDARGYASDFGTDTPVYRKTGEI